MSSNASITAPGRFITFEGGEGAGKTTQVRLLAERLERAGIPTLTTREPGGTALAERYRGALLSGAVARFGPAGEAMAFSAARIDHLDGKIRPSLGRGVTVVCDRFIDSTRAYQGAAGHLDTALIDGLERAVVGPNRPDLTVMLDLPTEVGLARAAVRRGRGAGADRFEGQDRTFHDALRRAFLDIASREPGRCVVIDGTRPPDEAAEAIWHAVSSRLFPDVAHVELTSREVG